MHTTVTSLQLQSGRRFLHIKMIIINTPDRQYKEKDVSAFAELQLNIIMTLRVVEWILLGAGWILTLVLMIISAMG
jgi:hypothetical protein